MQFSIKIIYLINIGNSTWATEDRKTLHLPGIGNFGIEYVAFERNDK